MLDPGMTFLAIDMGDLVGSPFVKAGGVVAVGFLLTILLQRYPRLEGLHPQARLVIRRTATIVALALTTAGALSAFEVDATVLVGTAGFVTIALGFAAQTSVSNVISGVFLMAERPFVIGDLIRVSDITGRVESVGLISVRLRTFDNLLIRIPNETMLKSNVTNLSHFPVRRFDMPIGIAYREEAGRAMETLINVADANPLCLEEPRPQVFFLGFGDSSVDLQLSAWTTQENWFPMRTSLQADVKAAFDRIGIEIPFPHRTIYAGTATPALPVRVEPAGGEARPEAAPPEAEPGGPGGPEIARR